MPDESSINISTISLQSIATVDKGLDPLSARYYQREMDIQTTPRMTEERSEVGVYSYMHVYIRLYAHAYAHKILFVYV